MQILRLHQSPAASGSPPNKTPRHLNTPDSEREKPRPHPCPAHGAAASLPAQCCARTAEPGPDGHWAGRLFAEGWPVTVGWPAAALVVTTRNISGNCHWPCRQSCPLAGTDGLERVLSVLKFAGQTPSERVTQRSRGQAQHGQLWGSRGWGPGCSPPGPQGDLSLRGTRGNLTTGGD